MPRSPARATAFSPILVATDFTPGARAAVDRALALPVPAEGLHVELVHVVSNPVRGKVGAHAEQQARDTLAKELARAREVAGTRVEISSVLLRGDAFVQIIRRARTIEAQLIVLGRHGRRPLRDLFVGSTASRVLRSGDTPLLIVREGNSRPYRRPVVGTDLGDVTPQLIELALRASGPGAGIRLVHAFHVPFEGFLASSRRARDKLRQEHARSVHDQLLALLARYEGRGRFSTLIVPGDPRVILQYEAARRGSDLLVVGTHGRTGIAHSLVGSVAESIIASAPCDVLVARPRRFTFELP